MPRVEKYADLDGKPISLDRLCRTEPEWAASWIRQLTDERDEYDSEIARLRGALGMARTEIVTMEENMGRGRPGFNCGVIDEIDAALRDGGEK